MNRRAAFRSVLLVALCVGWCFLLGTVNTAWGADGVGPALAATPTRNFDPTVYLLQAGPIGALVWGAYWLGKGVKLTVVVELSQHDRELLMKRRDAPT